MPHAILFDLGDTLIDFEPMDTRALFREAARDTYEFLASRGAVLPSFVRYCRSQFTSIRWAYLWAKLRGREFNSLRLLGQFCERIGAPLTAGDLEELAWLWYRPLIRHSGIEADLPATLGTLADAGIKLGIVSNTFVPGTVLDRHLDLHGLRDLFTVRVYSSEVGYRKPDRRIFQLALDELGVSAGDAIFVGDLLKTDIIGARRAGLRTVLKRPWGGTRGNCVADRVIGRISDLLDLLPVPAEVAEPISAARAGAPLPVTLPGAARQWARQAEAGDGHVWFNLQPAVASPANESDPSSGFASAPFPRTSASTASARPLSVVCHQSCL